MAYTGNYSITIDSTKCGSADSSSFPLLFSGTYAGAAGAPDLRVTGSGGKVTNASGYDIVFTSDSAGLNLLSWEIESYTGSTGAVVFWVQIPTLTHASNTVIYLWYGNSSITTFQGGSAGAAWDASYSCVYHFAGSLTLTDSTTNANTLTNNGSVVSGTGIAGNCGSFPGGSGNFLSTGSSFTTPTSAMSLEAWVNSSTLTSQTSGILEISVQKVRLIDFSGTIYTCGGNATSQINHGAPSNSNWHYIVSTITGTTGLLYFDGIQVASGTVTAILTTASNTLNVGNSLSLGSTDQFTGLIDEPRISSIVRTPSYITSTFNSISSPSTFYTLASIGPSPGGGSQLGDFQIPTQFGGGQFTY